MVTPEPSLFTAEKLSCGGFLKLIYLDVEDWVWLIGVVREEYLGTVPLARNRPRSLSCGGILRLELKSEAPAPHSKLG